MTCVHVYINKVRKYDWKSVSTVVLFLTLSILFHMSSIEIFLLKTFYNIFL